METAQAYTWVISACKADTALMAASTGGVWQGYAPMGTPMPYTQIIAQSPGTDVLTVNKFRAFSDILLQIKAVGLSSTFDTLKTIADRIDALFKLVNNASLSSGYVLDCFREQAISYEELVSGTQYSHLGGLYRVQLQGV